MSTTQPKKSVALIGNQMNVSKEWLDQVKILETGTTEQKIALAESDDLCDSIQLVLAKDTDTKVKIALSKNPKLTKLTEKILAGQSLYDDVKYITDEETLRILWQFRFQRQIADNYNIPESVKLDILDLSDDFEFDYPIRTLLGARDKVESWTERGETYVIKPDSQRYANMSKTLQYKVIGLIPLKEQKKKNIEYGNYWGLAHSIAMGFEVNNFRGVDTETQILLAENLVQLYQDIRNDRERDNDDYGESLRRVTKSWFGKSMQESVHKPLTFRDSYSTTFKVLKDNPSFNITAKVILSQIA